MRVGIDFDNTIVNYDGVFHSVAITEGLIPPHIGNKKVMFRHTFTQKGNMMSLLGCRVWFTERGLG